MYRKPIIIGIKSFRLNKSEKFIIKSQKPWGVILFKRNIKSFGQIKTLTNEIRKCINDSLYPILIDEEGGTVSRLNKLLNSKEFSQSFFGKIYKKDPKNGEFLYSYYLNSICSVLNDVGVNINTIPVMDTLQKSTHNIIKNRSFSKNIKIVTSLGKLCINTLKKNGIGSVIKHIPGHGCANVDSHKKLPIVYKSLKKLYRDDFSAFKNLNSHFAMTAHVLYKNVDSANPASLSKKIINKIIREKLNFNGLIISDDISMKALNKNFILNAHKALDSGCNLVLHCNGKIYESSKLLRSVSRMDSFTEKKTRQFYAFLR